MPVVPAFLGQYLKAVATLPNSQVSATGEFFEENESTVLKFGSFSKLPGGAIPFGAVQALLRCVAAGIIEVKKIASVILQLRTGLSS